MKKSPFTGLDGCKAIVTNEEIEFVDPLQKSRVFRKDDELYILISNLLVTPEFQRLRWLRQANVNYLVFPGSTHTRYSHSLGSLLLTMRACELINVEFKNRKSMILLKDILTKYTQTRMVPKGIHLLYDFYLASFLHDIGHLPFSHILENSEKIKELSKEKKHIHENLTLELILGGRHYYRYKKFHTDRDFFYKFRDDNMKTILLDHKTIRSVLSERSLFVFDVLRIYFAARWICDNNKNLDFQDVFMIGKAIFRSQYNLQKQRDVEATALKKLKKQTLKCIHKFFVRVFDDVFNISDDCIENGDNISSAVKNNIKLISLILKGPPGNLQGNKSLYPIMSSLSLLINSMLDLDKIDHYPRDSYFSGVKFADYNLESLLSNIRLYIDASNIDKPARIRISKKGLPHVLQTLYAKRMIWEKVLDNDQVRFLESLLTRMIDVSLKNYPGLIQIIPFATDELILHVLRNLGTEIKEIGIMFKLFYQTDYLLKETIFKSESIMLQDEVTADKIMQEIQKKFENLIIKHKLFFSDNTITEKGEAEQIEVEKDSGTCEAYTKLEKSRQYLPAPYRSLKFFAEEHEVRFLGYIKKVKNKESTC